MSTGVTINELWGQAFAFKAIAKLLTEKVCSETAFVAQLRIPEIRQEIGSSEFYYFVISESTELVIDDRTKFESGVKQAIHDYCETIDAQFLQHP